MGIGSKKFPPLPAPTETDIIAPTELTTADDIDHEDDGPADEASHFSLPDDGTPITIKTRGHKLNRSQTSLLIEYFEGGKTSPSASGVERKPSVREPMDDDGSRTPTRTDRVSRLSKNSPQPYNSVESGYGTGAGTHASGYSPKLENRNLNAALGVPTRRPSGPRAMTPKSAEEEEAREERRRKRATFGTVASDETDTF
ncbi:hypothetical protein BN1723_018111 [Verticillium longisporum]|uniref:Uncharacterized protein n=1 Tax=Verticillium longisporum TaxID=100787 RepID=A0A0G4LPA8_VERLO|nr:hypothetical protein BN1723_018111 [Verticillium longisporum]